MSSRRNVEKSSRKNSCIALINGATGQDGSYLAELLISKGYKVYGAVRDMASAVHKANRYLPAEVELVEWDMLDQNSITSVLAEYKPKELYNLAAYSSGSGMYDDPVAIGMVNGLAVTHMLEAIRKVDTNIRFCQASSREIFGEASASPQTELTPVNPRSPYGASKLYADNMIRIYRQQYGLYGCSAILYNHESPRRGLDFVTRKVTHEAAKIKLGLSDKLRIGNMDARRDWGFAGDYVRAMWLMLQQQTADDYIIATGVTHTVAELCEIAFSCVGLDYQDYISYSASAYRPVEAAQLVGSYDKAKDKLGWMPVVGFEELIKMMVETDMQLLSEG